MRLFFYYFIASTLFYSCLGGAKPYNFPQAVDTTDKPVNLQEKKTYSLLDGTMLVDNQFDGARLNDFRQIEDGVFEAIILPENEPINSSPWYAFSLESSIPRNIELRLSYPTAEHRYPPKLSLDGQNWIPIDSTQYLEQYGDSTGLAVSIDLPSGQKIYIAAQEIISSSDVYQWCNKLAINSSVVYDTIGQSLLGRPLPVLEINEGETKDKPALVFLSRQHPPEVTGFMCFQAFIEELLSDPRADDFFSAYRVLVFPLINPDGVDLGHWRHNAGGIDLNRDWAYYHQPETRQVADYIVRSTRKGKNQVLLGLDFHSTWYDVYYTMREDQGTSVLPDFKRNWLQAIETELGNGYQINEKPGVIGRPISARWFFVQFGAEGITYEIGDNTERD
ncbi:MAG: M14 family metallopeptidase, partial [Bacteroidota bacterium]